MSDINIYLGEPGDMDLTLADEGDINVSIGGTTSFQTLSDTPTSYSGQSGKIVSVKSTEDGVEFSSAGSGNVSTSGTPVDDDFAKFVDGTDIEGRSYTEVRTDLNIEDGADVTDTANVTSAGAAMSGGAFHDGFSDFVANEHLDWTSDQGATNIHSGNYTDTNTQLSDGDIGAFGYTKDVEVDWTVDQSPAVINAANYTDTGDTTAHASFSQLDYASAGHTGFAPALTSDQNYVTDANITLLGNTSGENTGDNSANSNYSGLVSNVSTNLSLGTKTATTMDVNSSDGNNATLVEADTTNAGILGSDKWDEIVANSNKATNVTTNITIAEAPTNVDVQSSDGSNDTIAAANTTNAGVMTKAMYDQHVLAVSHYGDNTQAHSDYLLNSGADVAVGPLTTTADNSTADQAYVPMVLYNTDDTPPAASGFPVGTLYVQYTA